MPVATERFVKKDSCVTVDRATGFSAPAHSGSAAAVEPGLELAGADRVLGLGLLDVAFIPVAAGPPMSSTVLSDDSSSAFL